MTFGWQGFQIDHPNDWSPAHLSGTYKEGYARIASPHRMAFQIRWRQGAASDLDSSLSDYLKRLEREAKKRKQSFTFETGEHDGTLTYRWVGPEQGRGGIFERAGRVFFVEAYGGKKDALLPRFRDALDSFSTPESELRLWSVLGLAVRIPSTWLLRRHEFQAGKTILEFERGMTHLECIRWGFAEQLLRQHEFESWARAALNLPKAACTQESEGLRLRSPQLAKSIQAIAAIQSEQNQIVSVKLTQFRNREQPEWEWLA